jgi:hypothetical protein
MYSPCTRHVPIVMATDRLLGVEAYEAVRGLGNIQLASSRAKATQGLLKHLYRPYYLHRAR